MSVSYRILYVDDEPSVGRSFKRALMDLGCHVTWVSKPSAALSLLKESWFDILASDYRMPEMNGIELLERARDVAPGIRRMLISGYCDTEVAIAAINRAAVDCLIVKPWTQEELLRSIDRVVSQAARPTGFEHNHKDVINEQLRKDLEVLIKTNRSLDDLLSIRTTSLLDGLVCALDLRDTETQWHSRRVAAYAKRLGAAIGLSEDVLVDVERGALLHDIGKIGISDNILLKPGKLTEDEWREMRRHPMLGYEMLHKIDFLANACLIVLQHQERWDGAGYPAGLRQHEICIGARIFHIVDAYDAITSDRPYRKSQPYLAARTEIQRCADVQFDPELVAAWSRIDEQEWQDIRMQVCDDSSVTIK